MSSKLASKRVDVKPERLLALITTWSGICLGRQVYGWRGPVRMGPADSQVHLRTYLIRSLPALLHFGHSRNPESKWIQLRMPYFLLFCAEVPLLHSSCLASCFFIAWVSYSRTKDCVPSCWIIIGAIHISLDILPIGTINSQAADVKNEGSIDSPRANCHHRQRASLSRRRRQPIQAMGLTLLASGRSV